ncbi:MAG: EAL domain-containing protein [Dokdonella sp.]
MKRVETLPLLDPSEEISALIETLHLSEQRLEELTGGEVDAVSNRAGRTVMLQQAQERMRQSDAVKQAAILNALPAHIALLDSEGVITSVNETWRKFASTNGLLSAKFCVGLNYVNICEKAKGHNAAEAQEAAIGIRYVLTGARDHYSLEYPCHSKTELRWFQMTVTPLADGLAVGAVVMHVNMTEKRYADKRLADLNQKYRTVFEASSDAIMILDETGFAEVNAATLHMFACKSSSDLLGRQPAELSPPSQPGGEDSIDLAERHVARALSEGSFQFEWMFRRLNGTDFLTDILLTAMEIDGKRVVQGTVRDITLRNAAEEDLKYKSTMLQTQLEASLDAILVVDDTSRVISYNRNFISLWRLSPSLMASGDDALVLNFILDQVTDPVASRVQYLNEHRFLRSREDLHLKDGRLIDRYTSPVIGADGKYYGRVWYFRDITERAAALARIKYLNRVFVVQSGISSLIARVKGRDELFKETCNIAVDSGGFKMAMLGIVDRVAMKIIPVAAAGKDEELWTYIHRTLDADELAANTMVARVIQQKKTIVSNDSANDPQLMFQKKYAESGIRSIAILPLLSSGEAVGAIALYAGEKEFFHQEEMTLLTQLADEIVFAMEHIDNQEKLRYLAYYDALTGLANRSLFLEHVGQHMRSAEKAGCKLAVAMIDIERFKSINDSLGWPTGDVLLKQVAQWMSQRTGDASLLARIGADHFAIVLPEVRSESELAQWTESLLASVQANSFNLNGAVFRIGFKMGVALFPDDGTDVDKLFKNAEAALKLAKANGNRYLFYTQKMTDAVAEQLALENELRHAMDNDEFVLHYQPKVDLRTGIVNGAEALIRWNHPRDGLVAPGKFITTLEQTGLIYEVGRWAQRQAMADYLRWSRAGLRAPRIAVNVSPLELRNPEFVAEVAQVIGSEPLAAAGLELEITESLIMADVEHSIVSLRAIRAMGVIIAIDDFGTGFSSLSHLSKLPVDKLKIDRCFVAEMTMSPDGLSLVSNIITLAHSMSLKVVAEGVETEEQKRLLRLLACDEMQGFLFSEAVTAKVFEERFLH